MAYVKTWGQPLSAYFAITPRGPINRYRTCNRFVVLCQIEPEMKDCVHNPAIQAVHMWRDDLHSRIRQSSYEEQSHRRRVDQVKHGHWREASVTAQPTYSTTRCISSLKESKRARSLQNKKKSSGTSKWTEYESVA